MAPQQAPAPTAWGSSATCECQTSEPCRWEPQKADTIDRGPRHRDGSPWCYQTGHGGAGKRVTSHSGFRPNRILDSYGFDLVIDPKPTAVGLAESALAVGEYSPFRQHCARRGE